MIEETASVVEIDGQWVWVETRRKSVCGQCAANKGCGTAVLQKVLGQKRNRMAVSKAFPVKIGDEVVIGIEENTLVRGSIAVYAVPLIALILFGLFGELVVSSQVLLTGSDALTVVFALAGLLVGGAWLRYHTSNTRYKNRYQPRLLRLSHSVDTNL